MFEPIKKYTLVIKGYFFLETAEELKKDLAQKGYTAEIREV